MTTKPQDDEPAVETAPEVRLGDGTIVSLAGLAPRRAWAVLARRNLDDANFQGRVYAGYDLSGLSMARATLTACNFTDALFSGAELTHGHALGAIFSGALLDKAALAVANLARADLADATIDEGKWESVNALGAVLDGATLNGASLVNVNFSASSMRRVKAVKAVLKSSHFNDACLDGADLRGADLSHASFVGASLRDVNLSRAVLAATDFTRADLTRACLKNVRLTQSYEKCNFTGLCMTDARDVPQDFYRFGYLQELDALLRRVDATVEGSLNALTEALGKLWLDHSLAGGDFLMQPLEELVEAAQALALRLESKERV